jgi:hypothetical protein
MPGTYSQLLLHFVSENAARADKLPVAPEI